MNTINYTKPILTASNKIRKENVIFDYIDSIYNNSKILTSNMNSKSLVNNVKEINNNNKLFANNKINNDLEYIKKIHDSNLYKFDYEEDINGILKTAKEIQNYQSSCENINLILENSYSEDIIRNCDTLPNFSYTDSLNISDSNNLPFDMVLAKLHLSPLNFESFRGVPISMLPEYFMKLFNSGHYSMVFYSKLLPDSFFLHIFTHRIKLDNDILILKKEIVSNIDIANKARPQGITNPIIKIPSDLVSFTDKHDSLATNFLIRNKDRILDIVSREEDYMFDVGLFLDDFYNLNSDCFNNLIFDNTNISLIMKYFPHLFIS